jgi:cyclopropane fatty-acyl-phospholipid synthase-like methyltransferase
MRSWTSTKKGGMINEGVVDFHPSKRYDIIVSISTFEHIGLDEKPKDPKKVLKEVTLFQ